LLLYAVHVMYTISSTLVEQGRVSIRSPSSLMTYESEMPLLASSFVMAYRWSDRLHLIVHDILISYGNYSHSSENKFGGSHVKTLFLTSMEAASAARSLVGTKTCCFRQLSLFVQSITHNSTNQQVQNIGRKTPNQ
jgi:hypothetical protein